MCFLHIQSQNLVCITLDNPQDVNLFHQDKNLRINYVSDYFILGTINDQVKFDYQTIENNAWDKGFNYYLLWIDKTQIDDYVTNYKGNGEVIFKGLNYIIVKLSENINLEFEKINHLGVVEIENKIVPQTINRIPADATNRDIDPVIEELIAQINQDSLQHYVQHLQDYGTRRYSTTQCVEAQNWIKAHFDRYGYETELQPVNNYISNNVIAMKTGTKYPDEYVVCGSHFDSYTFAGGSEPGADDNATGTAGMMEIARILSSHTFDRTIVICTFTAEEIGLHGSDEYATRCAQQGMNILGYFNIDMSGYLEEGSEIHTSVIHPVSATELYNFYKTTVEMYVPELAVEEGMLSGGDSDHTSFNQNGYMGIYPFEDANNYSPYIHSSNDIIGPSVNNFLQVKTFTKACMANVLRMSALRSTPQNLIATVDENQVVLNWNEMVDEITEFRVYRDGEQIGTTTPNVTTYIDYSVENNTFYSYYVTCVFAEDGVESDPSNTVTVYPIGPVTLPFAENWDAISTIPPYWSIEQVSGDVEWTISTSGTPNPHSSPNLIKMSSSQTNVCKIVSPRFDLSNASDVTLTFWHSQTEWYSDQDELRVYYKNSASAEWTILAEYTNNISEWTMEEIALPELSDDYYIAFEGKTAYGHGVQVDDITVSGTTAPPTAGKLIGTVVDDETGIAIEDITINLSNINNIYTATTNPNGFVINNIEPGNYTITATSDDFLYFPYESTIEIVVGDNHINIEMVITVGVSEIENQFKVYPNPAQNYIIVEGEAASVELFNNNGQLLNVIENTHSNKTQINTSDLKSGVYLLKVKDNQGSKTIMKVMIEK